MIVFHLSMDLFQEIISKMAVVGKKFMFKQVSKKMSELKIIHNNVFPVTNRRSFMKNFKLIKREHMLKKFVLYDVPSKIIDLKHMHNLVHIKCVNFDNISLNIENLVKIEVNDYNGLIDKIQCHNMSKSLRILNFHGGGRIQANISSIGLLTQLRELSIPGCKKIDQIKLMCSLNSLNINYIDACDLDIRHLVNLTRLSCSNVSKLSDLNTLTNLRILKMSHDCEVTNHGIKSLNVKELSIINNIRITDVRHMDKLKKLWASGSVTMMSDEGLQGLKLDFVEAIMNPKITFKEA